MILGFKSGRSNEVVRTLIRFNYLAFNCVIALEGDEELGAWQSRLCIRNLKNMQSSLNRIERETGSASLVR